MDRRIEELTGNCLRFYKFVTMTSTDVERSFSRYKNFLSNNRRSFEVNNLKKILVVQCNNLTSNYYETCIHFIFNFINTENIFLIIFQFNMKSKRQPKYKKI